MFADLEQLDEYRAKLVSFGVRARRGVKGVPGQRNAIMRQFPVETRIVEMDDDIDSLVVCPAPGAWGLTSPTCGAFASFSCRREPSLWGLYGVSNA